MKKLVIFCSFVFALVASPAFCQPADTPQADTVGASIVGVQGQVVQIQAEEQGDVFDKIEDNTHPRPFKDGWNLFGWVTFGIAFFSLFVGYITFRAQKKTEQHTTNAPVELQLWKLKDLPRHFYRNLVCTFALVAKYRDAGKEGSRGAYPSESNVKKLETMPDDIVLPIDISDAKKPEDNPYSDMHELKLLLRNYNVEVGVAAEHLSRQHITDAALVQDFDNLMFKPLYLLERTFGFERKLDRGQRALASQSIYSMMLEHFKKLKIVDNFKLLFSDYAPRYLDRYLSSDYPDFANFKASIDFKEGLDRSLNGIIKYGYGEQKKDKSVDGYVKFVSEQEAYIVKGEFVRKLEVDIKSDFAKEITSIATAEEFKTFCEKYYGEKDSEKIDVLYRKMKPYFDCLKQDEWDVHTLLKTLLAVDSCIEYDRIGMVNFA